MSDVFLLQNQDDYFLSKKNEWLDGREPASLFRTPHKDEAVNQMVEANARDFSQRIRMIACSVDARGVPVLDPAILPPPLAKTPADTDPAAARDSNATTESDQQSTAQQEPSAHLAVNQQ